jgi:hypothetical protein
MNIEEMQAVFKKLLSWSWVVLLAAGVYLMIELSLPYIGMERNIDFLLTKQKVYHIDYWRVSFYIHVFTSAVVLLAGFTQFRKKYLKTGLHRRAGRVYAYTVLFISAPTGFLMGLHANGGLASKGSFVLLSLLWFATTLWSLVEVRKKRFESHGELMLYSYALTLSAITFRLYTLMFDLLKIDARPHEIYVLVAWLSWVPNLLVAQVMIRNGFVKRLFKSSQA